MRDNMDMRVLKQDQQQKSIAFGKDLNAPMFAAEWSAHILFIRAYTLYGTANVLACPTYVWDCNTLVLCGLVFIVHSCDAAA